MLSHEFKTIFVHVPKTGGQSIEHVFLGKLGLTWEQRAPLLMRPNDDPAKGPERLAHLYASEYVSYGYVSAADFGAYFKFGVVRNPWARAASEYKFSSQRWGIPFLTFVNQISRKGRVFGEQRHVEPQKLFLYGDDGKLLVDRVLRFESLADEFAEVSGRIFGRREALPQRNVSRDRSDYRTFYDERTMEMVAAAYRDDIETFGYRFDDGV
jgi:Sulfotransferase family